MFSISKLSDRQPQPIEESLDSILMDLEQYGEPKLSKISFGWWCRIAMFVSVTGANFQIESECRHKTPNAAALECRQRVRDALRKLGK